MIRSLLLGGVAAVVMNGAAQAALVKVDVSDVAQVSGTLISDGFGDTGLVDFTWSAGAGGQAYYWNDDYSGDDAAYCADGLTKACAVTIKVLSPNHKIRLTAFTLGAFGRSVSVFISLTNTAGQSDGRTDFVSNLVPYPVPILPAALFVGPGGSYTVTWGPDGNNGGLLDITYEIERIPGGQPVSEPATLALLGAGLAGLAAARRRRG
jgi:hypothetical protein